jgi:hypothetical protein
LASISNAAGAQGPLLAPGNSEHVAKENCAVAGDQFSDLQAVENLPIAIALIADLDRSLYEAPAVSGNPDCLRAVAFSDNAV